MAKKYKIISQGPEPVEESVPVVEFEDKVSETRFAAGQPVSLNKGAESLDGKPIPTWMRSCRLFVCGETESAVYVSPTKGAQDLYAVALDAVGEWKPFTAKIERSVVKNDMIRLKNNAKYFNGDTIPSNLFDIDLYAREIRPNGNIVISTQPSGLIYGVVNQEYVEIVSVPYLYEVMITSNQNARMEANTNSLISAKVEKGEVYKVLEEKGSWLKTEYGWIYSKYVKKI